MKTREIHRCEQCGFEQLRWQGQCPGCGAWNTLAPRTVAAARKGPSPACAPSAAAPTALEDVDSASLAARSTGVPALDELLGAGLVPGGALLLAGEPGVGKSTLLLQLAGKLAAAGRTTVYASGEESLPQLRMRAERLGLLGAGLMAVASTSVDPALDALRETPAPELVIVDSVQTLTSPRAEGAPGSVTQVRAVAAELVELAKTTGAAVMLVGHVTKEGQIAGPKLLEHMVDTVLSLEGERRQGFRLLRVLKNRFGPSDELLVFSMEQEGLAVVEDPSTFFLGERERSLSGAAVVMALDGSRPLAVEIQVLASRSFLNIPRRTALGFDTNRLHLLLAVLEKRLSLNLGQFDIYAKIGGGLALRDPALDLGVVAATLSSFYDRPVPEAAVFWGEVDLNGQVRPVVGDARRLKQARRLGYNPMFRPGDGGQGLRRLQDLQQRLFG
ncbi:MAG: DNA repair protein RadA [Desulfovibrionaceae bacterium]